MQGLYRFHNFHNLDFDAHLNYFARFQRQSRPRVLARVGRAGLLAAQVDIIGYNDNLHKYKCKYCPGGC